MEEQVERKMNKNLWGHCMTPGPQGPSASSKYARGAGAASTCRALGAYIGLETAIAAELMIGFWFGIGVILAVKTLESLEYCISIK